MKKYITMEDVVQKSKQLPNRVVFEHELLRNQYRFRNGSWKTINLSELSELNTMFNGPRYYGKSTNEVIKEWREENNCKDSYLKFPIENDMDLLIRKLKKKNSPKYNNMDEDYFETIIYTGGYGYPSLKQIMSETQWNRLRDYNKEYWISQTYFQSV